MLKSSKQNKLIEKRLYNKILLLARNKLFYTKLSLDDSFENRIYLIFFHISFLFLTINTQKDKIHIMNLYQNVFDFAFNQIEINMREIGFGDVLVNKKMKILVKDFYNILLNCEKFKKKNSDAKNIFLQNYFVFKPRSISSKNSGLLDYFVKYQSFCFNLTPDSVLNGELNFIYK